MTRAQLLASGVSVGGIRRLHRILPAVYSQPDPSWMDRCRAVLLWQPTAVLSHRTAARLYGWIDEPEGVDATVAPAARHRPPPWLTLHRRRLDDCDEVLGLPVVTREQALLDCVAVMDADAAARLVDERLGWEMDPDRIRMLVARSPNRRGNRAMIEQLRGAAVGFASEPERLLDRAMIARGLRMQVNARVGSYVVDFHDEGARLVVEVDGRAFHSEPEVFRRDRARQNRLVLAGYRVLRYAAYDVLADADAVASEIVTEVRRRRHARR